MCLGLLVKTQGPPETAVKVRDAFENGALKAGAEVTALSYNKKLMALGKQANSRRRGFDLRLRHPKHFQSVGSWPDLPSSVAVHAAGSACLLLAVSLTRATGQLPEERLRHGV